MIYFIVQDWQNTHGNHAGMLHLCKEIEKLDSSNVRVVVIPNVRIRGRNIKIIQNFLYALFSIYLSLRIENGSKVFLMEYLLPTHNQYFIANILHRVKKVRLFGLAHLVPADLEYAFKGNFNKMLSWTKPLDGLLTLGSSLTTFLINKGVHAEKIHTLFHYVDLNYYTKRNNNPTIHTKLLKVIIMGSMKRDVDKIIDIINRVPNVHFIYCAGRRQINKNQFLYPQNVTICGYLPEDELKALMDEADISLNVMIDTIGSNVITTSLAMNLAMVVSDVGSIRDYCDDENALFCQSEDDFVESLSYLAQNIDKVHSMKIASGVRAKKLSIPRFYKSIQEL